jgi:BASS family bile acid:Na+ symporter
LPILIVAYLLAGTMPAFGVWLRQIKFGAVHWPDGSTIAISPSLIMLSFLLFNAGLGIQTKELIHIRKKPIILLSGFIANIAVPIVLVLALGSVMHQWHNADELQNLLVGLALIVSMPIAGSSAAWSQNANGNLSLSLGLVLLSTVLSPVTTPTVMDIFSSLTTGDYSSDLRELATQGTDAFIMITVVLPSLLGVLVHFVMGNRIALRVKPYLKLINFIFLLLLNYSNGSSALPQSFSKPDPDFLGFILTTTIILCSATFGAGWLISKCLKTDRADQAALMFGLGMNNNGTGLVLAAATLSDHPSVMLPMIFYTLAQQVIAGIVDWKLFRNSEDSEQSETAKDQKVRAL